MKNEQKIILDSLFGGFSGFVDDVSVIKMQIQSAIEQERNECAEAVSALRICDFDQRLNVPGDEYFREAVEAIRQRGTK